MSKEKGKYGKVNFIDGMFAEGNDTLQGILREVSGSDEPRVLIVADSNVVQKVDGIGRKIGKYFQDFGIRLAGSPVVLSGSEKIKCEGIASATQLISSALDAKIGVNDIILAIGGGTVLDVAGYVAMQIRSGVRLVRVPTTPAAMIDAAFSEMAAINFHSVKNALSVPCEADAIVIDTSFASTVLDGVWRAGAGEAVRYAAVQDSSLMKKIAKNAESLKNRDMEVFSDIVRSVAASRVKKGSTSFALWSANRLESMSGYKLPHGYAVPIAVCIDCAYAVEKGILKESDQELICRALADSGALDGLAHSHHLLSQADNILYGLDAWRLSSGAFSIEIPSGLGKLKIEENPDRETFKKVIKEFLAVSSES